MLWTQVTRPTPSRYRKLYRRVGVAVFTLAVIWSVTLLDFTLKSGTEWPAMSSSSSSESSSYFATDDLEQLKVNTPSIIIWKSVNQCYFITWPKR